MVQSLLEMINSSEEDKQQQIEVEEESQPDPSFFLSNGGNQKNSVEYINRKVKESNFKRRVV